MKCPCHSGKPYASCCQPIHTLENAPRALELMRSRYAAYALGKIDYLLHTTHSNHMDQKTPLAARRARMEEFSRETQFVGLTILDFQEEGEQATVTFRAHLMQQGHDVSFTEKSLFAREGGKWKYLSGAISSQ